MENNAKELKQCTRCHSTILLEYFATNRKGELYKSCNNCRGFDKARKDLKKNRTKELEEQYEKLYEMIYKIPFKHPKPNNDKT